MNPHFVKCQTIILIIFLLKQLSTVILNILTFIYILMDKRSFTQTSEMLKMYSGIVYR